MKEIVIVTTDWFSSGKMLFNIFNFDEQHTIAVVSFSHGELLGSLNVRRWSSVRRQQFAS